MNANFKRKVLWGLGVALAVAAPAVAGTKFQTSLVPLVAGAMPGFSSNGSSIKLDDHLNLSGKIKKVVDGSGALVTTDGVPSADDYHIEVDIGLMSGTTTGTVSVPFDLKNGNGKFQANLTGNPALAGGMSGDGVAVNGVRVRNASGTLLGVGGVALR